MDAASGSNSQLVFRDPFKAKVSKTKQMHYNLAVNTIFREVTIWPTYKP